MMHCLKNSILKTIAYIDGLVFLYFACCLDAYSWIPFIICCITGGYMALFIYANDFFDKWVERWLNDGN